MEQTNQSSWRHAIHGFIQGRLDTKLEALEKDKKLSDTAKQQKRDELLISHQPGAWLEDAAIRVKQIQLATHTLKPIHPDAKGSQVFAQPNFDLPKSFVGSHSLTPTQRPLDVVGNAAALDVFKLLKLCVSDSSGSLLDALQNQSSDAIAALSQDANTAMLLATSLLGVLQGKSEAASHSLGKQLFFPTLCGDHLLAPLYPTQLAHAVHEHLQVMRFSDSVKLARAARKSELLSSAYRDYPNLLTQSFGGTKPQNISQLNSERGGRTHLFANLPPDLSRSFTGPPFDQESVFDRNGAFARWRAVQEKLAELREYLHSRKKLTSNMLMREDRAQAVQEIVDELLDFAAQARELKAGWSLEERCKLRAHQQFWLDPYASREQALQEPAVDEEFDPFGENDMASAPNPARDWPRMVAREFASWFNMN